MSEAPTPADQIDAWLQSLGLEEYTPIFHENHVDAAMLPRLTDADLQAIGIASWGHRQSMLSSLHGAPSNEVTVEPEPPVDPSLPFVPPSPPRMPGRPPAGLPILPDPPPPAPAPVTESALNAEAERTNPAAQKADAPNRSKSRRRLIVSIIVASVVVHAIFGGFAGIWVIARYFQKPKAQFTVEKIVKIDPEPREHQVSMQELDSLRPRPVINNRIASLRPTDLSLPDLPKTPVEENVPLDTEALVNDQVDAVSTSRVGQGMGNSGSGTATFFGIKSDGGRVAYLVDYSNSMKGARDEVMRQELSESIEALPDGTEVALIFFAGKAWIAGEDPKEEEPKARWIKLDSEQRKKLLEIVRDEKLQGGTKWENPFIVAYDMNPPPAVIYFMTDGSVDRPEEAIALINEMAGKISPAGGGGNAIGSFGGGGAKSTGRPRIYTIALGEPRAAESLEKIASEHEGSFRLVEIDWKKRKADGKKKE